MVEEKAPELIQKPSLEEPIETIISPAKKERKKKEKPKNPVSFTPVKKNLNRYTVTGNVNSKGTKYRVTEIIDAQDDKIANSIFKERAKKSMGGIRNITKVVVEAFKEGDEAGKEEIVENLPKSEPVQIEKKKKKPSKKELLGFLDKALSYRDKLLVGTVERVLARDDINFYRAILKDSSGTIKAEAEFFALDKEVKELAKDMGISEINDEVIGQLLRDKVPFMRDIFKATENASMQILQVGGINNLDVDRANKILNTIEGESRELRSIIYETTNTIAVELGLDMSILDNIDFKFIHKEDLI